MQLARKTRRIRGTESSMNMRETCAGAYFMNGLVLSGMAPRKFVLDRGAARNISSQHLDSTVELGYSKTFPVSMPGFLRTEFLVNPVIPFSTKSDKFESVFLWTLLTRDGAPDM